MTIADLPDHLNIKVGTLLYPLGFQQLSPSLQIRQMHFQLLFYGADSPLQKILGGDIMRFGIDSSLLQGADGPAG